MNLGSYEGNIVSVKNYSEPLWNDEEILRWYCGSKKTELIEENTAFVLNEAKSACKNALTYKVCYLVVPIKLKNEEVIFPFCTVKSKHLAKNLYGCQFAVIFAATVGVGIDRLIEKYNRISMSKAVCFQAIGNERVETLCDEFNREIVEEIASLNSEIKVFSKPRYSPGYGDLSLDFQKNIFDVLKCNKNIGVTLNESLLMSPSKSVTAIIGIGVEE